MENDDIGIINSYPVVLVLLTKFSKPSVNCLPRLSLHSALTTCSIYSIRLFNIRLYFVVVVVFFYYFCFDLKMQKKYTKKKKYLILLRNKLISLLTQNCKNHNKNRMNNSNKTKFDSSLFHISIFPILYFTFVKKMLSRDEP